MNIFEIIGAILMTVISIVIVVMVTAQNPDTNGMSGLGGGGSDSYMSRSGDRSLDATLNRFIKAGCIVIFVLTVAVYAFGAYL